MLYPAGAFVLSPGYSEAQQHCRSARMYDRGELDRPRGRVFPLLSLPTVWVRVGCVGGAHRAACAQAAAAKHAT